MSSVTLLYCTQEAKGKLSERQMSELLQSCIQSISRTSIASPQPTEKWEQDNSFGRY